MGGDHYYWCPYWHYHHHYYLFYGFYRYCYYYCHYNSHYYSYYCYCNYHHFPLYLHSDSILLFFTLALDSHLNQPQCFSYSSQTLHTAKHSQHTSAQLLRYPPLIYPTSLHQNHDPYVFNNHSIALLMFILYRHKVSIASLA